jgi:hypothetical protein
MDPNAAFDAWLDGDDEAGYNLVKWLLNGGFEPDWDSVDREAFFDIVDAHYWWHANHHDGQWSECYATLCRIGEYFTPSILARGPATENARAIYTELCKKAGCCSDEVKP